MKVLLAIDGSACSELAAAEVARRPWPAGTIVHAVTVDAPIEPSLIRGSPTAFDEIMKQKRAEAQRTLTAAVDRIQRLAPDLCVLPKLLEGAPKDAILAEAESWGADLIVVGSHGYGPIRRLFLGSVSSFLSHNSPCSVLIVRCTPVSCPLTNPSTPS